MASGFYPEIIKCRACGARDVEVVDRVRSNTVVSCYQCGTVLWTWPEFLNRVATIADDRQPALFATERTGVDKHGAV
jgi:hypothetical protein